MQAEKGFILAKKMISKILLACLSNFLSHLTGLINCLTTYQRTKMFMFKCSIMFIHTRNVSLKHRKAKREQELFMLCPCARHLQQIGQKAKKVFFH